MVYKQRKKRADGTWCESKNWSYKFEFNGREIRKTTKQSNKRVAESIEAAAKTALAKGEVGIVEKKPVPTLAAFADERFLPFVRTSRGDGDPEEDKAAGKERHRTTVFYETTVRNLKTFPKLAKLPLDRITSEILGEYAAFRRAGNEVSTVNRELATVRRIFNLAQEWGSVTTRLPRVRLLPGENGRIRVLSAEEVEKYLDAALQLGREAELAYQRALTGIRAVVRGEVPIMPDAYLLRDTATILLEEGLRPEECYRMEWAWIQDGGINVPGGKGRGARRRVPLTSRAAAVLDMRRSGATSTWVFPRDTKSGHITGSTIRDQHDAALIAADLSGVVIYDFRHTRITRWAKALPLPVVQRLAGHTSIVTTMRYVHISDTDVQTAMRAEAQAEESRKQAQVDKGRHTNRHTDKEEPQAAEDQLIIN
jgi:integrase